MNELPHVMRHSYATSDWPRFTDALRHLLTEPGNREAVERLIFLDGEPASDPDDYDSQLAFFTTQMTPSSVYNAWDQAVLWVETVNLPDLTDVLGSTRIWNVDDLCKADYWLRENASDQQLLILAQLTGAQETINKDLIDAVLDTQRQRLADAWTTITNDGHVPSVPTEQAIRMWARQQGLPVGLRGRLSNGLRARYEAAVGLMSPEASRAL